MVISTGLKILHLQMRFLLVILDLYLNFTKYTFAKGNSHTQVVVNMLKILNLVPQSHLHIWLNRHIWLLVTVLDDADLTSCTKRKIYDNVERISLDS
jgi:hypothetical protein